MEKVKVGIAGLGRLGKVHANNIAYKIPNAELTAACSIMPADDVYRIGKQKSETVIARNF